MFTLDPYLLEVFYGLDNWWAFLAQQQKFLKRVRVTLPCSQANKNRMTSRNHTHYKLITSSFVYL